MRLSIKPRPAVIVRPEIRAIRPPGEYIDILTKDESEFRQYIAELESNPTFNRMQKDGIVRKVGFKGRIPSHIYQEFQDKQFMQFLNEYGITNKAGWESDFFDKKALRKVKEISAQYKVPRGDLVKALEYCKHLQLSWDGKEEEDFTAQFSFDDPESLHQLEDTDALNNTGDTVVELAELIEENGISEQDFVKYFLSGNVEPFDIARDLELDLDTVEEIIDAVDKVNIVNSMQVNVVERQENISSNVIQTVAIIKRLTNPPRAEIQIDADKEYSFRYNIEDKDGLGVEESSLIDKLRMINQRRSLTFRVIQFIYKYQYPYFVSINPCYLRPLSQAQLAREVGEHESTISRILRNKHLETDEGTIPIRFFCQSKQDIIKRIIQVREQEELKSGDRDKPFSDAEIADILEKEYGVKVSRRTVTYYRNKTKESPKFYKRKKMMESD
jgi:DNA-directed RNA polymerase specialized sigma54-like protein